MENLSFTGKYWLANQSGNYFCLEIHHDPKGQITGSLSGKGMVFGVTAIITGKKLVGKICSTSFSAVYFKLYRTFNGFELSILDEKNSNPCFRLVPENESRGIVSM